MNITICEDNIQIVGELEKIDTYEFYSNLSDILVKLNMMIFVRVHNSYIVNMEYIKTSDANYVILTNGEKISITKKFYKDFNTAYRNFVLMRAK